MIYNKMKLYKYVIQSLSMKRVEKYRQRDVSNKPCYGTSHCRTKISLYKQFYKETFWQSCLPGIYEGQMNRKLVDYKVSYGYFQIWTSGSGDEKAVAFLLAMAWLSTETMLWLPYGIGCCRLGINLFPALPRLKKMQLDIFFKYVSIFLSSFIICNFLKKYTQLKRR